MACDTSPCALDPYPAKQNTLMELKITWRRFAISAATLTESSFILQTMNKGSKMNVFDSFMLFVILWSDLLMPARVTQTFLHYDPKCILLQSLKTSPKSHLVSFWTLNGQQTNFSPKLLPFWMNLTAHYQRKQVKKECKISGTWSECNTNVCLVNSQVMQCNEGDSVHISVVLSD